MTIEILQSCSGEGFLYPKGQIVTTAPAERVADLVQAGYARVVADALPPVAAPEADPVEPETVAAPEADPVEPETVAAPDGAKRKAKKYETPEDGSPELETR